MVKLFDHIYLIFPEILFSKYSESAPTVKETDILLIVFECGNIRLFLKLLQLILRVS